MDSTLSKTKTGILHTSLTTSLLLFDFSFHPIGIEIVLSNAFAISDVLKSKTRWMTT